jgi:hypothetical protein
MHPPGGIRFLMCLPIARASHINVVILSAIKRRLPGEYLAFPYIPIYISEKGNNTYIKPQIDLFKFLLALYCRARVFSEPN